MYISDVQILFWLDSDSDFDSDLEKLNPDSDSRKNWWIRIANHNSTKLHLLFMLLS